MNVTDLAAELVISKAKLAQLNEAVLGLADPTIHRYTLDTGQTQQVVWRHELPRIYDQIRALQNEVCTMEARLGTGSTRLQPGF